MAYCTEAEVTTEFKDIDFTLTGAAVVTADVTSFIAQAGAEMDSILSARYSVPVTQGASAMLLLKQICIWLVSQRIKDIVEVKNVRDESDQDVKTNVGSTARKMLAKIVSGEMKLIGADLASSAQGVKSYVSANNVDRQFKKDEEQW